MTRRVQKLLFELDFTRLWTKSGLMDEEWLAGQVEAFKARGEANREPYHFEAFQRILDTRERLTDQELADYVVLALERRYQMQDAVLTLLIGWRGLRPHQLRFIREYLLSHIPRPFTGLSPQVQQALDRRGFLFSLTSELLTDEQFARHLETGDPDIHDALLNRKGLTATQLEQLAQRGASRLIREAASARLEVQEDRE